MKRRPSLPIFAAVLALAAGTSCASEPDSTWGTFAGAWEDGWNDSGQFFQEQFFGSQHDDPYNRKGGWAGQGGESSRTASRMFLDSGDTASADRIQRSNPRREENAARTFFHWLLDVD